MSISTDKSNVLKSIEASNSIGSRIKLPDKSNIFSSVNNKKEALPFLLDVSKSISGSDALKDLTGQLLTDFTDGAETKVKESLGKQLTQYSAGLSLPDYFVNDGISVPVKDIDVFNKLKTNPDSDVGSLLYDKAERNFDAKAYDAISLDGTPVECNNMEIAYDSGTDSFNFKPKASAISSSTNIGDFFGNYVNDSVIVNKKEILTKTMNAFYGSVTAEQGKTIDEIYKELQISKLLQQLIEDDNDTFELSQEDFDALLEKAKQLKNGIVYYDLGCGLMGAKLPFSGLTNLINQISGSTDPQETSNAILNTIDESTSDEEEVANKNKQTIKDSFFDRIIKILQQIFAELVTSSPQIRMLMAVKSAIENNGVVQIGNPMDDFKKFKVLIKCIIKDFIKMINEFIFKIVKAQLIALLVPIITEIIKEKINQYVGIIKSLVLSKIQT